MGKSPLKPFLSQLCSQLVRQRDSFEMAKIYGQLILKYSKIESAVLIWPDSDNRDRPLRREILGQNKISSRKVFAVRFHDHGDIFFRIDFFATSKVNISAVQKKDFRQGHKLVSEAIEANELRHQTEELARFHWMRHLSAGLSHEMNTPLTTLFFHTKKLAKESDNSKATQQVKNSLDAIGKVLNQYRFLSGDGQFVESHIIQAHALGGLLRKEFINLFPDYHHWISVKSDVAGGSISAQSDDLVKLVGMILKNSVEAVRDRLRLEPELRPSIEVHLLEQNEKLTIKFTDNGGGIKPEHRAFIFAPFFSTKDVDQGSGLGLSVARAIAFLNNGSLRFNPLSEKTQFILELPLAESIQRKKVA